MNTFKASYFRFMIFNTLNQFLYMVVITERVKKKKALKEEKMQDVIIQLEIFEENTIEMNMQVNRRPKTLVIPSYFFSSNTSICKH